MKRSLSILAIIFSLFLMPLETMEANDRPSAAIILTETEIDRQLTTLPEWTIEDKQLRRTFQFENFVKAVAFINSLVEPSEKLAHHPDLLINYNRVTVSLTTHDAGGLTQQDFDLAKIISELFNSSARS
jgi:4a-hydroxytetrahydrobiopterin dehydratase